MFSSKIRLTISVSTLLLLLGCASSSPIQPASTSRSGFEGAVYGGESVTISANSDGGEEYRIFHQGASGFVSVQTVRDDVETRGKEFCDRKGKAMKSLQETASNPPHILGNFPRVEIVFECIERPSLVAPADVGETKYTKLGSIKKLLDNGVLTQAEFEIEKAKILSKP